MIIKSAILQNLNLTNIFFNFKMSDSNFPSFAPFICRVAQRHSLPCNQGKPRERGLESVPIGDCIGEKEDEYWHIIKNNEFSTAPQAFWTGMYFWPRSLWLIPIVSSNAKNTLLRAKKIDFWLCPWGAVWPWTRYSIFHLRNEGSSLFVGTELVSRSAPKGWVRVRASTH